MFCSNCGTQLSDGEKFCPNCGAPVGENAANAGNVNEEIKGFSADDATRNADAYMPYNSIPLKTDRSLLIFILLSIVTCGIYNLVFLYQLITDVNIACEGDGDDTPGFWMFFLLTIVTCGIYGFIWYYKLSNRLQVNCARYGQPTTEGGSAVLLWMIFGIWLCGIGTFIAWNILINNTNTVCAGYNRAHGLMA